MLRLEEVEPQVLVWLHPQIPLANRRKMATYEMKLGAR
jgi:hypothetical protein